MRLVVIGWGAMAQAAIGLLDQPDIELVAVGVREPARPRPSLSADVNIISKPEQLSETNPDVVAEAASVESVDPWGHASLAAGADFIVSSVAALADPALIQSLRSTAIANGARLCIQTGALAGIDALTAAAQMGIDRVEHRIIKPPKAWLGTEAENLCPLSELNEPQTFFESNAAETARQFPKNANVAMTTALAAIGPEATKITLIADPNASGNSHEINAAGDFGELQVTLSNKALSDNPKTSAMAALNLARSIKNRLEPIVIA